MQVYPVTWLILFGVVGSIIAFGMITNLLGAALGPWRSLAGEFPEQPRLEDADKGTAPFSLTKKPYASYARTARRTRSWLSTLGWVFWLVLGLLLVLGLIGMLGGGLRQGLMAALSIIVFGFYTLVIGWWSWRILTMPAWPTEIEFVADDDHLHFRRVSDVVARYPWLSVPWGAIGEFEMHGDRVSFPIGSRWGFTSTAVIQRELRVRAAMSAAAPPGWSPTDAPLAEGIEPDEITPQEEEPQEEEPRKWF